MDINGNKRLGLIIREEFPDSVGLPHEDTSHQERSKPFVCAYGLQKAFTYLSRNLEMSQDAMWAARGRSMAFYSPCPPLVGLSSPSHSLNRWREGLRRHWLSRRKYLLCGVIKFQGHGSIHDANDARTERQKQKVLSSLGATIYCLKGDILGSKSLNGQTIQIHLPVDLPETGCFQGWTQTTEKWKGNGERTREKSLQSLLPLDVCRMFTGKDAGFGASCAALSKSLHLSQPQGPIYKREKAKAYSITPCSKGTLCSTNACT